MKKHVIFRILFTILSIIYSINIFAQEFKTIGISDGLSQPSVMCIYQDDLGRMWFGTREGVNIYDGNKVSSLRPMKISDHNDNKYIVGNNVKKIVGGKNGDVFLNIEKHLYRYHLLTEQFELIHKGNVDALATSLDKDILFVAKDSLYHYSVKDGFKTYITKFNIFKISCINQISESILYIGAESGLYKYNFNTKEIEQLLFDVDVNHIFHSSRDVIWIATRMSGLYVQNKDGKIEKQTHSPDRVVSNQIREFTEDNNQNIWFGTFDGLQKYDPRTDTYTVYRHKRYAGSLSHSSVFSVYRDREGTIWVGTYYGGVNYFNLTKDIFKYYFCDVLNPNELNFPLVGDMQEDKRGNIWIATDGGGVHCLIKKTQSFKHYTAGNGGLLHNNVKSLSYDKKRDIMYVGTHTGGLSKIDCKTGSVYNYLADSNYNKEEGPNEIVYYTVYHKDKVYVSARNGLWRLNLNNNKFELILSGWYDINFTIDENDCIWLNSGSGFGLIDLKKPIKRKVIPVDNKIPSHARITKIASTSNNDVYITTSGCGIYRYDYKNDKIYQFTKENNNLLSNYCYNVCESNSKNILISTDKGVSIYSPHAKEVHSITFGKNYGLSQITSGCGIYVTKDNKIYVGLANGMIAFNEEDYFNELWQNENSLYFSKLQVNYEDINPGDETGILKVSLPFTKKLVLKSNQNNIIVDFASSNYYSNKDDFKYEYCLEGLDADWIEVMSKSIHYTNLPFGDYILRIRNKNDEISLPIKILTPWYRTTFAYILFFFLIIGVIYAIWRFKISRKLLELSLAHERNEKIRAEEVNQMKLRFFTNVSHEFRTPLTLLVAQIEILLHSDEISLSIKRKIEKMHRSTIHLRSLISELLDFRRMENGAIKLKVKKYDFIIFLSEIFSTFKDQAEKKDIKYSFTYPKNNKIELWFDFSQMQKIIYNLLSNAFKYTPQGGRIELRLLEEGDSVFVEVEDTGCGISKEDVGNVFDRFYQAGGERSTISSSSGIGLALTKGLVDLHGGEISVSSKLNVGSIFRVKLLLGKDHFSEELLETSLVSIPDGNNLDAQESYTHVETVASSENEVGEKNSKKPVMLLVEDEKDILEMLEDIFKAKYIIHKAENGQQGFDMAYELQPDIIISDVMMPVMSGKEMCAKIKNCIEISHIPVLLLTAQTAVEQKVEGFEYGADDYVTKPFNVKLLMARCNNLVNTRLELMKRLSGKEKIEVEIDKTLSLNASDKIFMDKVKEIIVANFDNVEFNMNNLAEQMHMGRTKLYYRFKEITSITPNEYALRLKFDEAKELLEHSPELNISDISYKLGFSSLKYFSKSFKSFSGISPQKYRNQFNS